MDRYSPLMPRHQHKQQGGKYRIGKWRVALLEQQLQELQLQHSQLEQSRHALQLQASMAQEWCDALLLLLLRMPELQGSSTDPKMLETICELEAAAQEASLLLSAYDDQAGSAAAKQNDAVGYPAPPPSVQQHASCIVNTTTPSPASPPSLYFKELIARDPVPSATSMTGLQMARLYRETVLESSLHLHQMPHQSDQQKQDSVCMLQQLWDRYIHTFTSSFLVGHTAYLEVAFTLNMVTMQHDAEGCEAAVAGMQRLLPALHLTQQQEDVLAASYCLFLRQHERITAERRQLQQVVAATDCITCSVPGDSSSSSDSSSDSGACEQLLLLSGHCDSRRLELDRHQQTALKLHKLLQKEMVLRTVACSGIMSCLSWEQTARLAVLLWPYHTRYLYLAKAVYDLAGVNQDCAEQQQQEEEL